MWKRIAADHSFWFEPSILACYRVHGASATSRFMQADNVRDVRLTIDIAMAYHPPHVGSVLARQARALWAGKAIANGRHLLVQGHSAAARKQVIEALRMSRNRTVLWKVASFLVLWGTHCGSAAQTSLPVNIEAHHSDASKDPIESQSPR
jgi:hypothetical protein